MGSVGDRDVLQTGAYIFDTIDLLHPLLQKSPARFYNCVRGIFQRNSRDEPLSSGHEDLILMYVLTLLHPKLPEHIRDKFKSSVANTHRRILDFRTEILSESDLFLNGDNRQDVEYNNSSSGVTTPYDERVLEVEGEGVVIEEVMPQISQVEGTLQEADEDREDVEEDLDDENDMEQNSEPEENVPELGQSVAWVGPRQPAMVKMEVMPDIPQVADNHLFHMQLEPEFDLPEDNARQDDDEDYYPPNLKNPKKNAAAKKYSCDQCRFVTVSTAYLNRHMEAAHGALLSCQECADFTTHSSKDMKQHVAATHTNNYSPPSELKAGEGGGAWPCVQCGYAAKEEKYLIRHMRYRHSGIQYVCNQCDYVGTSTTYLKQHIRVKHEGVRYQCPQCSYSFTAERNLKRHIVVKHGDLGDLYMSSSKPKLKKLRKVATMEGIY